MSKPNINIAVVSHRRPQIIKECTAALLEGAGLDFDVFLSDDQDLNEYGHGIKTNANSLSEKINFVKDYYPPGSNVVIMEDDLQFIRHIAYDDQDYTRTAIEEINQCLNAGAGLVGISQFINKFYVKDKVHQGAVFCVGYMFGFKSGRLAEMECEYKSDYERSVKQFIKYRSNIRLSYIYTGTKNYTLKGGLQLDGERGRREDECSKHLANTYPQFIQINEARKGKSRFTEIRFKQRR